MNIFRKTSQEQPLYLIIYSISRLQQLILPCLITFVFRQQIYSDFPMMENMTDRVENILS